MIEERFETEFKAPPAAIGRANGRMNLIGEHLDYQGGMVLPTAIAREAAVAVGAARGDVDEIHAERFDETVKRALDAPSDGHWSDYVAGALQLLRRLGLAEGPMRVAVESDIPHGAGLSSSAAVIVATIKACLAAHGAAIDNVQVARWAQQVEHEFIGMPCGIMDQMAVAMTAQGQALALDTHTLAYSVINLPSSHHFAVLHSGVTRKLEDGRYAERRRESEAAAKFLDAPALCLMSAGQAAKIGDAPPPGDRRARHVYTEHHRVLKAIDALTSGDMETFGALMTESHASMRDDFEMSTPEIDRIADYALHAGALGARLTGGGFGGCIVACVPAAALQGWVDTMTSEFPNTRFIG